jgi:dTDP-4-dehydrorhamnose 3,5-epimerase
VKFSDDDSQFEWQMSVERFVRHDLKIEGACTYELIENVVPGGGSIELFHILKSHPCPDMPQITVSRSKKNVIRGLHCSPHHKMVCCPTGKAFDVVVDLRPNSPTFLQWDGAWLTKNKHIVIPPFCGHGFFSAEDDTSILYLQGGCFAPALDFSVVWDDPSLKIQWPAPIEASDYIISAKDKSNPKSGPEIFDKIKERMEKPIECLKLGAYADFGIVADEPSELIGQIINRIQAKGKTWHFCYSNGRSRETLQDELYALKPGNSVIYLSNADDKAFTKNFIKLMNVAASADVRKFSLTILLENGDAIGNGTAVELLKANGNNTKIVSPPKSDDEIDALISSLIE